MAGWYELSNSSDRQFRFVLKTDTGDTVLTSELSKAKSSAANGIASVQANSLLDERDDRKTAPNGKGYFTLQAANHQVIGTSQMYATEASRESDIARVKADGSSKTVKDST